MGDKMRIYVGGLGSNVQESDLKKTFTSSQLGTVESVEIIRSKGRSFAYLEFVPASDKGLAKLYNTYNGCLWKGGKLKLEKAKEDYICRLKREWAEDAQVEVKLSSQDVDEDESVHAMQTTTKYQDIDKLQLKIFFPKLMKIKPIPLKGTGKHKYSFQRVEVPPLPIHFCDCEEHCGPPEPAKRNDTNNCEMDSYVVNENELNMMKSILSKVLEKETCSETVPNEAKATEKINHDASLAVTCQVDDENEEDQMSDEDNLVINMVGHSSKKVASFEDWGLKTNDASLADKWQVNDDNEEDQMSDEDNLVINVVGHSSKKVASFEDWGQKTTAANQDSLVRQPESKTHGTEKGKHIIDKKRKQSFREDKTNDTISSRKKGRNDSVGVKTQPVNNESGSIRLTYDAASSNKPAWKALVTEKGRTTFNISDIVKDFNSAAETKPRSEHLAIAPDSNENDGQQYQSSKHIESEKNSAVQSTKTTASEDILARGASWLQKSSWLQLVGDPNTNAFNLAQIRPDVTFEKQELQQSHNIDFSNLSGKHHTSAHKDKKSPIEDVGEPREGANKNVYATPGNPSVDVLTKEQNNSPVVNQDPSSAPMLGASMIPNNRVVGSPVISESCPFMKTAASMKEWMKSKAALSGSHKKKEKGKELVRGR